MDNRQKKLIRVSWVSIVGNAFLSLLKVFAGIVSGSLSVIADGVDSATDVLTSIITLVTARIIAKPPNAKYPYGYAKAENIATKIVSFIILFAGFQLAINTIGKLVNGTEREMPTLLGIYALIVSIVVKLGLAIYNISVGKKTNSSMLMANGRNMQNDIILSVSVLTGLLFTFWLKMPLVDSIVALLVSFWIIKVGFSIFIESNVDLMDGQLSTEIYRQIFDIIDSVEGVYNPHRVRVRKFGHRIIIAADIEIDGHTTLYMAHEKAHEVEKIIRENIPDVFEVFTHLEPVGDNTKEKKLGVSRNTFNQ